MSTVHNFDGEGVAIGDNMYIISDISSNWLLWGKKQLLY
jgi:hypothetical protein